MQFLGELPFEMKRIGTEDGSKQSSVHVEWKTWLRCGFETWL